MSLRLAVWCPQGRASLPLAARLLREQLPADLIVWSSDEPMPIVPVGVGADLWIVLCSGDPPPPPAWRSTEGGIWAVHPGAAALWTRATQLATESWQPDRVLTDLLPDETESPVWYEWLRAREFVWIPAWVEGSESVAHRVPLMVIQDGTFHPSVGDVVSAVVGTTFACQTMVVEQIGREFCARLGEAVAGTERVLVCSEDPVLTGLVVRLAFVAGADAFVCGPSGRRGLRPVLLTGQVSAFDEEHGKLAPVLRRLAACLQQSWVFRPAVATPLTWLRWLESIVKSAPDWDGCNSAASRVLYRLNSENPAIAAIMAEPRGSQQKQNPLAGNGNESPLALSATAIALNPSAAEYLWIGGIQDWAVSSQLWEEDISSVQVRTLFQQILDFAYRQADFGTVARFKETRSMFHVDVLILLRFLAAATSGAVVELGAYVGGATTLLAKGVRPGRKVIAIEPGGKLVDHPSLSTNDILRDLEVTLHEQGVRDRVELISGPSASDEVMAALEGRLQGERIGVLCIDTDCAVGADLERLESLCAPGCVLCIDDYVETNHAAPHSIDTTKEYVDRRVAAGELVAYGSFGWGTWFGRLA